MKSIFITGNHPRHAHIAQALAKAGKLDYLIIEEREAFVPEPPTDIDDHLKQLFVKHFELREETEHTFFGEARWPDCPTLTVTREELNGDKVQSLLKSQAPDLVVSYGCHMLSDTTLACAPGEKWNCHGGLSPWYKGTTTHFWPSYLLEPQMTGMTVHDLTNQLDAGDVVHQCTADLVRGDGVHALAARAVIKLSEELPLIIDKLEKEQSLTKKKHKSSGMLWLVEKWRPEHLRVVYELYNDRVVDAYLDGKLSRNDPKLYRQI